MNASPVGGLSDKGCYPEGADSMCEWITRAVSEAWLEARVDHRVMRMKYGKLLENLANAVQALCGLEAAAGTHVRAVSAEGNAVLQAAEIALASEREMAQRPAA